MAASAGSGAADEARVEQICAEFVSKAAYVVLQSRVPGFAASTDAGAPPHPGAGAAPQPDAAPHPGGASKPAGARGRVNSWFNLETAEPEATRVEIEPWRRDTSLPLLLEVSLVPTGSGARRRGNGGGADGAEGAEGDGGDRAARDEGAVVLERWSIMFVRGEGGGDAAAGRVEVPTIYKRAVILLRTLFCKARLMPAAAAARAAGRSGAAFEMRYALRTSAGPDAAASPTPRRHEFAPVRTPFGSIYVAVAYSDAPPIAAAMMPPASRPRIIADYCSGSDQGKHHVAGSAPTEVVRRASWSATGLSAAAAMAAATTPPRPAQGGVGAAMPTEARTQRAVTTTAGAAGPPPAPVVGGITQLRQHGQHSSSPVSIPISRGRRCSSGGDLMARDARAAARVVGFSPGGGARQLHPVATSAPAHTQQHGLMSALARSRDQPPRAPSTPGGASSGGAGGSTESSPKVGLSCSPSLPFAGTPSSSQTQLSLYGSQSSHGRGFVRRASFSPSPPTGSAHSGRDPMGYSPRYGGLDPMGYSPRYGGLPPGVPPDILPDILATPVQHGSHSSASGSAGGQPWSVGSGAGSQTAKKLLTYHASPAASGAAGSVASSPANAGTHSDSSGSRSQGRSTNFDDSGALFSQDLSTGGSAFPFAVDEDERASSVAGGGSALDKLLGHSPNSPESGGSWPGGGANVVEEPVEVAVGALVSLLSEAPSFGGAFGPPPRRGCATDVGAASASAAGSGLTFRSVMGRLQTLCDEA